MLAHIRHILSGFHDTTMFLSLMLWLCVAPFILLITLPFFGWQVGVTAIVIALLLILAACWGICLFPKNLMEVKTNVDRSRVRKTHQTTTRSHRD